MNEEKIVTIKLGQTQVKGERKIYFFSFSCHNKHNFMYIFKKMFHSVINSHTAIFDHLALIPPAKVKVDLNHFDVQFRKNLLCTAF